MMSDFRKLIVARFFFTFGVQMQAVILGWRIYELLQDPLALGMIGLTEAVPAIGLALYAGYLVDRLPPVRVYRRVIFISFISGVIVLLEHLFADSLSVKTQAGLLYFAAFLTGLARAFAQPAIFAIVPRLVPKENLLKAIATMSSVLQMARVGGPALGGLIFGFFGAVTASSIVCISLIFGITFISLLRAKIEPPPNQTDSIKDEFFSGVRFVFSHPVLFPALTLDMISTLFAGVTALLPIFATDILQIGPKGLGLLRAAPALGATTMSLYLALWSLRGRAGPWLLSSVAAFGMCIIVFGLSRNVYLSFFALTLAGVFDSISMVIRSALVQMFSPDHMRGKVSAVNSIFIGSSNEIGEVESGVAAKILGVIPAVLFGGVMCLFTVGIMTRLSPALRQLDLEKIKP